MASSRRDLLAFPDPVIDVMGMALSAAQFGGKHPFAYPWKGQGAGVFEIVRDFDRCTYRVVYTVQFAQAIYVLHCFKKKSPKGIATAQDDVKLVARRLRAATLDHEVRDGQDGTRSEVED